MDIHEELGFLFELMGITLKYFDYDLPTIYEHLV